MTRPISVAFEADCIVAPPRTGVGHYADQLVAAMERQTAVTVQTFAKARPIDLHALKSSSVGPSARPSLAKRALVVGLGVARTAVKHVAWRTRDRMRTRAMLRGVSADVFHAPNHTLPLGLDVPSVLTVHDLSVLRFPQWHPADRIDYFSRRFTDSVARASAICTVSGLIRDEVVALLGKPAETVHVTPLGVGEEFRPLDDTLLRSTLAPLGLETGRYALFLGTREPRKNLDGLLDAWEGVPSSVRGDRRLVLAGPPGWQAETLERRIDRLEARGLVRRLGYVSDEQRPALYAGAAAFFYPSFYEGFGLPPLEAAASGTPVVTSIETPMAETLAGAALVVNPHDGAALRDALRRALEDEEWRRTARMLGPEIARRHSWAQCASRTIAAYRSLVPG